MIEKTGNVKGAGLHWDIVLLCIINAISAIFGGEFFYDIFMNKNSQIFLKFLNYSFIPFGRLI